MLPQPSESWRLQENREIDGKRGVGEHINLAVQLQACLGKYTLVEENLARKNKHLFNCSIITIVFVLVLHKAH